MKEVVSASISEAVGFVMSKTEKPHISWRDLYRTDPELATRSLLDEASSFIQEHGGISQRLLAQAGERALSKAITRYYPGGFIQIKVDSGIPEASKKNFDLSKSVVRYEDGLPYDKNGRVIWTALIHQDQEVFNERVEEIAKGIVASGKNLSEDTFRELSMTGYYAAVNTYYPEGMRGIREKLGFEVGKPFYYWHDAKNIEEEARKQVAAGSNLSQISLYEAGATSLNAAIGKYYPGGVRALRQKLGVANPSRGRGYWNIENIETELRAFLAQGNTFSLSALHQAGLSDLANAITRVYPDGRIGVMKTLGIIDQKKPMGYWKNPRNIENEAKIAIAQGSNLSQDSLHELGFNSLVASIGRHYPGGLSALRQKLEVSVPDVMPNGYWTEETIEKEAREFYERHGVLTQKAFREHDRQGLGGAISQKYPGSLLALKRKLGIKIKQKYDFWTKETIESEARKFMSEHGDVTHKMLRKAKRGDLSAKVHSYPGGMGALRAALGFEIRNKPPGYWTVEKIEEEARAFLEEFGNLSQAELVSKERSDLLVAISKKYPRKLWGLKVKLGLAKESNVAGYWTEEKIIEEAREFLDEFGVISHPMMTGQGRSDLCIAIVRKYPGGIRGLLKDLGLPANQTEKGSYTLEKIKELARELISEHGDISYNLLKNLGKSGLGAAIAGKYPGKMIQLRLDLGLSPRKPKPVGYWTIEKIEEESRKFYEEHGVLSQRLLNEKGRHDLQGAISSNYPGRLTALQKKLEIPISVYVSRQEPISPEQGQQDLWKLLEVANG